MRLEAIRLMKQRKIDAKRVIQLEKKKARDAFLIKNTRLFNRVIFPDPELLNFELKEKEPEVVKNINLNFKPPELDSLGLDLNDTMV